MSSSWISCCRGSAASRCSRASKPTSSFRNVPVLVITAWNETREDVIAAGAADFASKPFDPDALKSVDRETVGGGMRRLFAPDAGWSAASAVLALVVVGVFVALILALSALREARRHEEQSKQVTTSALRLEKLVLDIETGAARLRHHRQPGLPPAVHSTRSDCSTRASTTSPRSRHASSGKATARPSC